MSTKAVCPSARRAARRRSKCATPCSPSRTEAATPAIASPNAALSICPLPMRTGRVVTESRHRGKPAPAERRRRTLCYSPACGRRNDILGGSDARLSLGDQIQKIFPKRRSSLDSLPGRLLYSAWLWRWGGEDSRLGDGAVRESLSFSNRRETLRGNR